MSKGGDRAGMYAVVLLLMVGAAVYFNLIMLIVSFWRDAT